MPTHGSLTKAGKVRSVTGVRSWRIENGKKRRKKKHKDPMRRARRNYKVRILYPLIYGKRGGNRSFF